MSYRLAALAGVLLLMLLSGSPAEAVDLPPGDDVVVTRVVDGDTIEVTIHGQAAKVRYIGIDAPERDGAATEGTCHAEEATAANSALIYGQTLRLQRDKSDVDRYGRLLRYAYLPDGRMVNAVLVETGFALAKRYPPDTQFSAQLAKAQEIAQASKAGLWTACRVVNGAAFPLTSSLPDATAMPAATAFAPTSSTDAPVFTKEKGNRVHVSPEWHPCEEGQIKGNRNSMIFHAPGQRDYAYTFRNVECFNTESEAQSAGYRKAKR